MQELTEPPTAHHPIYRGGRTRAQDPRTGGAELGYKSRSFQAQHLCSSMLPKKSVWEEGLLRFKDQQVKLLGAGKWSGVAGGGGPSRRERNEVLRWPEARMGSLKSL